mgnify:CR=1 FL=1
MKTILILILLSGTLYAEPLKFNLIPPTEREDGTSLASWEIKDYIVIGGGNRFMPTVIKTISGNSTELYLGVEELIDALGIYDGETFAFVVKTRDDYDILSVNWSDPIICIFKIQGIELYDYFKESEK